MSDEKPTRKKAVNGRAKGAAFEGTIVKLLSTKFEPMQFRRSQSSGAILGGKNEVNLEQFSDAAKELYVGDVVPSNTADCGWQLRFTIECKFYKEPDTFQSLFANPQLASWYDQAETDASKIKGKLPLLIFKWNHTKVYAAFPHFLNHPKNTAPMLELSYNWKLGDNTFEQRIMKIALLDDLLEHPDWWKVKNP